MEIPDIPDNRPHKSPSVLSYSPTIVLDDATDYGFESQPKESDYQDMRKAPPVDTPQDMRQEVSQDLSTPEPQEKPKGLDAMPNGTEQ